MEPRDLLLLESVFSSEQISESVLRLGCWDNVPFDLIHRNKKREISNKIIKKIEKKFAKEEDVRLYVYLWEFEFHKEEIINAWNDCGNNFRKVPFYLFETGLQKISDTRVLEYFFTPHEIHEADMYTQDWDSVAFRLMQKNRNTKNSVNMFARQEVNAKLMAMFQKKENIYFYKTLWDFGFESDDIVTSWRRTHDWYCVSYDMLRAEVMKQVKIQI